MPGPYAYIRQYYGIDPIVGATVRHRETCDDGVIARPGLSHLHYVRVRFPGRRCALNCHPNALDFAPTPRITLEAVTPAMVAIFAAQPVLIWSGEYRAWWRPDLAGYTALIDLAGVYTLGDAYAATSHVGPEKRISFEQVRA